jgi:membrane associated rhomboid family serine protease
MDRFLARLERTIVGRFAIEGLTTFIVGGMAIAFVLCQIRPEFQDLLTLQPQRVLTQPWRLVSFLFVPPDRSLFHLVFALYFTWLVGSNLEQVWGTFKFNAFYTLGALATLVAGFVSRAPQDNEFLHTSLFFAFATLFPDTEFRLFFILPVKVKWLGLLSGAYVLLQFVAGDLGVRLAIVAVVANYLLFFAGHLRDLLRGRQTLVRQAARRAHHAAPDLDKRDSRACAMCGIRQDDGADIRVCSCAVCGGVPRDLCVEHARNH